MSLTIKEELCRLCAERSSNYHSIFNHNTTDSIVEKIHKCLPLVINANDKLPTCICDDCLIALNISDKLRTQSLLADSFLRRQLTADEEVPSRESTRDTDSILKKPMSVILIENIKQEKDTIHIKTETESIGSDFDDIQNDELPGDIEPESEAMDTACEDLQENENSIGIKTENESLSESLEDVNRADDSIENRTQASCLEDPRQRKLSTNTRKENSSMDINFEEITIEKSSIDIKTENEGLSMDFEDEQHQQPSIEIKTENEQLETNFDHIQRKDLPININRENKTSDSNLTKSNTIDQIVSFFPSLVWICELCRCEFNSSNELIIHKHSEHIGTMCNENAAANTVRNGTNVSSKTQANLIYLNTENSHTLINSMGQNISEDPLDIKEEEVPGDMSIGSGTTHCQLCKITIEDQFLMGLHLKFHQPYPMYCNLCNFTFPSPYNLYIHQKSEHDRYPNNEIKWFCAKCDKLTDNAKWLKKHLKMCSKQKYKCKYCDDEFVYKNALVLHEKKQHYDTMKNDPSLKKYKCELCDKSYAEKRNYNEHMREHIAMKNGTHKCTYCEKIFPRSTSLRKHIQEIHERDQQVSCDICSKVFDNKSHLSEHRRLHDKLACIACELVFDTLTSLDQHCLEQHNIPVPNRKYYCNQCGQDFQQKRLLKDHQNKHTGMRPYVCQKCRKTFRTYAAYYAHRQTHTHLSFYCDHCKHKFSTKRSLVDHMPKHSSPDTWKYNCELCQIKFPIFGLLLSHLKKLRSSHIVTCDLCGIQVLGMHKLKKHKIHKHRNMKQIT